MEKAEYLKTLEEIEWFNHPQNDQKRLTNKINESEGDYYLDLHHFSFFSEDFFSEEDYKKLFDELEQVTGLKVVGTEIHTDENENTISVTGNANEKAYAMTFDLDEFAMVPQVEEQLNDLFEQLNLDSRLLWLPLESDIYFYVFIPVQLYKRAVEKGIIPEESDYTETL